MSESVFARYRLPCLLADQVRLVGTSSVELRRGARSLVLDVTGPREAALADLRALQRGRWRAADTSPLAPILNELDALGWLGEARPDAHCRETATLAAVEDLVARGRQALDGVDAATRRALKRRLLPHTVASAAIPGTVARPEEWLPSVQDVLVTALLAQGPRESTLHAYVLARLFGARVPVAKVSGWTEDVRELEIAVAALVFWALQAETAPMPLQPLPALSGRKPLAADQVLRESEAMLRDWNAAVPDSPILSAPRSAHAARLIARGIHLQQYYVSIKYVESVLPVLIRNSKPALRALVWRYLQEELGHEGYELAACQRLGLRASQVRANVPLPAFAAFHRLISYAAELHPVAWLTVLPLAEGLPGERKPLPGVLASAGLQDAAFAAHVEADVMLDHAWMARRIAAQLGMVDTTAQRTAAEITATAWALTRLGWEQLVGRFGLTSGAGVVTSAWDWEDCLAHDKQ